MQREETQKNGIPKYLAIANDFRAGIKARKYNTGDLLPDSHTLSRQLGCSRPTLQKAFDILEREGYVRKIQGSGVYVDNGSAQEEAHSPIDIENLSIIGVAGGETITIHSAKLIERHIENTILACTGENRQYMPLCLNYISDRELKAKLSYYRNILGGLIIYGVNYELLASSVRYASGQNIPVVFAGLQIPSQLENIPVDTVYVDEFQGGYDVGQYFIEKGHTEIGFVHDYNHNKLGRIEGLATALKENGLKAVMPLDVLKDLNSGPSKYSLFLRKLGADCVKKLMKSRKRPTAIMCQNDLSAIGAFEELNRMKISMPDEVELFGFADDVESRLFFSNRANPISTVALPKKAVAEASFKLLVQRMNNPGLPTQIVTLPTAIIHRETTKGENVCGSKLKNDFLPYGENDIEIINKQIMEKLS